MRQIIFVAALAVMMSIGVGAYAQDVTPPEISGLMANPGYLWPPNGKMIKVTVSAVVVDDTDLAPTWQIVEVTSNEPEDEPAGDGDPEDALEVRTPDWEILSDTEVNLRAERLGTGEGRVYTITIEATDAFGNTVEEDVEVYVPHDMGDMKDVRREMKLMKKQMKLEQKQARKELKAAIKAAKKSEE